MKTRGRCGFGSRQAGSKSRASHWQFEATGRKYAADMVGTHKGFAEVGRPGDGGLRGCAQDFGLDL